MAIHHLAKPESAFLEGRGEIDVSLLIPARNCADALEATVLEAERFLSASFPGSYEIILIPNPGSRDRDRTLEVAESLAGRLKEVRSVPHRDLPGKGAALRTGLPLARGRMIFFTDADLPYDLGFFAEAARKISGEGYGFVTGNRRLDVSLFNVPVGLLHLAYGRHRLGLAFNRVVRLLFPGLRTTDTQAGIKAMSRELAREAFSRMECPGFFFDLEIFLTARRLGFRHIELPVLLELNSEKSTVRILRESVLAAYWLARITRRNWRGDYGSAL